MIHSQTTGRVILMGKHLIAAILLTCSLTLVNSTQTAAQVGIFDAGTTTQFIDIGINPVSNDIVLVGSESIGGTETASVYNLSADRSSFSRDTLVGLGLGTTVSGISPDGFRIAGTSQVTADRSEGTTWISSAANSPTGIGLIPSDGIFFGPGNSSSGVAAWNGGIVGEIAGGPYIPENGAYRWEPNQISSISTVLEGRVNGVSGDGRLVIANDSYDGGVVFGLSGSQTFSNSSFESISPNGSFIGGFDFFDLNAQLWTEDIVTGEFVATSILRQNESTDALETVFGSVADVSDSGYAVINTSDGVLIWNESFNGIDSEFTGAQYFDEWILALGGVELSAQVTDIVGVAEQDGVLHFAANSTDRSFVVSVSTVPEPSSAAVLLAAASIGVLQRRRRR